MIIFIYGEDTFRSKEKLAVLKERFKKEVDPTGINITEFAGKQVTLEQLVAAASSSGFLARKRMVVVKDAFRDGGDVFSQAVLSCISRFEASDNVIIFWEAQVDKRKVFFKTLSKGKYSFGFDPLDPQEVASWINERARLLGCSIHRDASVLLSTEIGNDLWRLSQELDKLRAYACDRQISRNDVSELVKGSHQEQMFALVDAMVNRSPQSLILLSREFEQGMEPLHLHALLLRQVRILITLKGVIAESAGPVREAELATKLSLHPYVVKKAIPQARACTAHQLLALFERLRDIEEKLKSTKIPAGALFDMLVVGQL